MRHGSMRIALDARKLHDFGIGTYIRNLVHELARLDPTTEYVLFARPGDLAEVAGARRQRARRRRIGASRIPSASSCALPLAARRAARRPVPRAALRAAAVCAGPHRGDDSRLHPPALPAVPAQPRGLALRAHDDPAGGPQGRRASSRCRRRPSATSCTTPACAPTRWSSSTTASTRASRRRPTTTALERVRQRFDLGHPFVLYVGNIKPHKNLERLIEAFALARAGGPDDLRLVVIGDEISKYPALRQSVHRHRLDKHVRFFGFQPAATLVAFYRLARAFVFPSLYEGFGLPPLEAMANLHAGRHLEPVVAARGGRRRGRAGRSVRQPVDRRRHPPRRHRRAAAPDAHRPRPAAGAGSSRGEAAAGRTLAVYRDVLGADADARRAGARLAHRHARGREGPRADLRRSSPAPSSSRWCTSRARVSPAHRSPPDPHRLHPAAALRRPRLPALPAALPGGDRTARPARVRPGRELQPLRGQVGDRPARRAATSATA